MIPSLPPRVRRPWGLLGAFALIWLVEAGLARNPEAFRPGLFCSWIEARAAASGAATRAGILCFGDSQVKLGVAPRILEERTGLASYNLAVARGLPASSVFLLRRALEAGARPRAVVVDGFPGLLESTARLDAPLWPIVARPVEVLGLAWEARDLSLLGQSFAAWLVPTIGVRHEVRTAILAAVRGGVSPVREANQADQRKRAENLGAMPIEPTGRPVPPDDGPPARRWRCRPENERRLREFLALARSRGIVVFWLIPPLHPATATRWEGNGRAASYDRFVRSVAAEDPGVIVVDASRSGFEPTDFVDKVHLNAVGARKLSAGLAAAVNDGLARPPSRLAWRALDLDRGGNAATRVR